MLKKLIAIMLLTQIPHVPTYANDNKIRLCEGWRQMTRSHYLNHQILLKEQSEQQAIFFMKDLAQYSDYDANSSGKILLDAIISGLKSAKPLSDLQAEIYAQCMKFSEWALLEETIDQDELIQ